ncbi:MAG: hypothetical protein RI988_3294 [Pseudomonadota bacterium]
MHNGRFQPFDGLDLGWLLATQAQARGAHPFIVFEPHDHPPVSIGYAAFHEQSRRLAAAMLQRGLRPGERVLLHMDNCIEFMLVWCACGLAGLVVVTTNTRSSEDELRYFADHSGAVAAFTQPRLAALVARSAPQLRWIAVTSHDGGEPAAQVQLPARGECFERLLEAAEPAPGPLARTGPDTPLAIQFTSGTTSRPKAVLWTHANALWAGRVNAVHEGLRVEDVHLCVLPTFHTNALAYSVLASLWMGATVVLQARFSSSRYWDVALRHGCTWASMMGFCYRALMQVERPAQHAFRQWGTAFCDPAVHRTFGIPTVSWWGMTETLTHGIVGVPHMGVRPGTIGRAAPEYGVRVVGEDGQWVEPGQTGTLQILGVPGLSLFQCYDGDRDSTARAFTHDGWFDTGDQILVHEDGLLQFADRRKDMLKVGGENVASSEIERVIGALPFVAEVAVIGRPHPMLDEVPVALVLPRADAPTPPAHLVELVLASCRAQLADFKVPREVHVVDEFPRANVNKIAKGQLREQWRARWAAASKEHA